MTPVIPLVFVFSRFRLRWFSWLVTAKINEAEAALTAANAAITEDIRGLVSAGERAALEAAYDRAIKGVLALHERLNRAIKDSDVITPQSGK